jgi:hypothetical protein
MFRFAPAAIVGIRLLCLISAPLELIKSIARSGLVFRIDVSILSSTARDCTQIARERLAFLPPQMKVTVSSIGP